MKARAPFDPKGELQQKLATLDDLELRARVAAAIERPLAGAKADPGDLSRNHLPALTLSSGRPLARRLPAGSWIVYHPDIDRSPDLQPSDLQSPDLRSPRRWLAIDRSGHVMEALEWLPDGALARARVRLADDGWLEVRPRAATHVLFGEADAIVVWRPGPNEPESTTLTVAGALDWAAIDHLPALDRPGALPPGGGSALFTLIAGLIGDQSRAAVRYRGPYPTRALFDRLLIAFRPRPGDAEAARQVFIENAEAFAFTGRTTEPAVDFEPAPPERLLLAEGTLALLRDGIEEVIDGGRVYAAGDPLATLWAGREGLVLAGLAFLGEPLEEHLVLDPHGELVARIDDRISGDADGEEVLEAPLDDRWRRAIAALVISGSANVLVRPLLDLLLTAGITWGPTDGRWVEAHSAGWRLHGALPRRFRTRTAAASTDAARAPLAGRFVTEVARALGDPLGRAAQDRFESDLLRGAGAVGPGEGATASGDQLIEALRSLLAHLEAGHAP